MKTINDATRELLGTRVFHAPKALVLRMWSNPQHLTKWWGPKGFTTTTHAMDFQTGGVWKFTMHGPDGRNYPSEIRYRLVTGDRIQYDHFGDGGVVQFAADVSLLENAGVTEMTFQMEFVTPEMRRVAVEEYGAEHGLQECLVRLGEQVAQQDPKTFEIALVRRYKAPRDLVWKAITDPAHIEKWGAPMGLTLKYASEPTAVGAKWTSTMSFGPGDGMDATGEILAIDAPNLLRYTHRWKKEDGTFKPTTTITITLTESEGQTTLTFEHAGFWSEEAALAHKGGWASTLIKLGTLVDGIADAKEVSLVREFKAPIDLVWKSFTEAERVAQWFTPAPYTTYACKLDFRPGGEFNLTMRSPTGDEHTMHAEITDIEPQQNLCWLGFVPGSDGEKAIENFVMVSFEAVNGGTKVTVNSHAAAFGEAGKMMVGGMEQGWSQALDQCVAVTG